MQGFFKKIFSYKKIFNDFFLNIVAASLLTVVTQVVVLPYLSRIMTAQEYGSILTMIALVSALGVAFGNSLNNTRILMQKEYDENDENGDYNPIFLIVGVFNAILVAVLVRFLFYRSDLEIIACVVIAVLVMFRAYFTVAFRLIINYKKYLITSVFGVLGYLLGLYIATQNGMWYMPYVLGELFACIYVVFASHIIKDKLKFTPLLKKTLNKYVFIFFGAALSTAITYMDRFFIYPVLGAEQVAVFNVASYMGKTAGIIMIPISGVLLTYYAKEKSMSLKSFYTRAGFFALTGFVFLIGIYTVGQPILRLLYPTLIDIALEYYFVANLAVMINIFSNTIQPVLLRYARAKWQPIIQGTYLACYIAAGLVGMNINGLMGFCYAILIVNSIKVFFMVYLSHRTLARDKQGEQL